MKLWSGAVMMALYIGLLAPPAHATSPGVAGGYGHSVALKSDGTVWTWGYNEQGQLGVPGLAETPTPVQVRSLTGMTAVASGETHTVAVKSDGTVWTWGDNSYGQLGTGGTSPSASPVQVPGLTGVIAVAAGTYHSIVLKSDGTVWGWGYNLGGQLGNGTVTNSYSPVQVVGLSGATAIATGWLQCVALKSDGSVWTWGEGPLGNGEFNYSKTPMKVPGLTRVIDIAVGGEHVVVLRSDGAVWTWGANRDGQLGDGTDSPNATPARVTALSGEFAAVAAGPSCTAAVRKDGSVWMWGANEWGQLGTGNVEQSFTPIQVSGQQGVANLTLAERHTMSAHRDGSVWIWGANEFGQIGNGSNEFKVRPTQLVGLAPASAVAAASAHSMALHNDGTVSNWGFTVQGGLGDGLHYSSYHPVRPAGVSGVKAIATGSLYSMALTGDATITSWGLRPLGFDNDTPSGTPSTGPGKVWGLSGVAAIAAGDMHAMALKSDGTAWTWGDDEYGQLGNDTYTSYYYPGGSRLRVEFTGISGIKGIAAGLWDSLALKGDGSLWASGVHKFGATPQSTLPVQLQGLLGVKTMAPGAYHTLVVKTDGTVWAWGGNDYGALGNGSTVSSTTPVQVSGLSGVVDVDAGYWLSFALREDGTVWAWGRNNEGQLGNGSTNMSLVPVQVTDLADVTNIACGGNHVLAVKKDGSVWAWGSNNWGELGLNPGWSPLQASINLGAGQSTLSGTVHAGSTTGPVLSGATVAIAGKWANTDSAGAFSITGIPAGTYTLTISKGGYAPLFFRYVVSASDSGLNFVLVSAPTYFVSGTIRSGSSTGPGLPAVKVAIAGKTVVTDSSGAFSITDIVPGTYTVSLYKFGYITKSIAGFAVTSNRSGVTFYMVPVPTYSVSGTVRKLSSSGILLPGVSVTIAGKTVTTNSSGAFTITGIAAGTYSVYLYKAGYVTSKVSGLVITGNKTGVALYLTPTPTYSLSGVLRSGSGTGPVIAGATVSIAGKAVTTSSTGTFTVGGILYGYYSLVITKVGYTTKTIDDYLIDCNKSGLTFVLAKQTAALKGQPVANLRAHGRPPAGSTKFKSQGGVATEEVHYPEGPKDVWSLLKVR